MNEKKSQNKSQGKLINVTIYDTKGIATFQTSRSFDSRSQLLRYVKQRGVPGVAAITFNNQPVVFDKTVIDYNLITLDHEYYLNPSLQTISKTTHEPVVVPVDVVSRLVAGHRK